MQFIGYHGTSESSALDILNTGIRRERLPRTGQIGPGFYIAKAKGKLPEWGAVQATASARNKLWAWQTFISRITGEYRNLAIPINAKMTILKIYTTKPLVRCKWNPMNPIDLHALSVILDHSESGRRQELDEMLSDSSMWLQMVIPPEELKYLRARRDDGLPERTTNWLAKESPF